MKISQLPKKTKRYFGLLRREDGLHCRYRFDIRVEEGYACVYWAGLAESNRVAGCSETAAKKPSCVRDPRLAALGEVPFCSDTGEAEATTIQNPEASEMAY
jgi:hypothetical protein